MGETVPVTRDTFKREVLEAKQPVLVDFWAHWSGPCRHMEPIVDEVARENPELKVCRINVEREPELAGLYRVAATPTLMLFQNGQKLRVSSGSRSKENVMEFIGGGIGYEGIH